MLDTKFSVGEKVYFPQVWKYEGKEINEVTITAIRVCVDANGTIKTSEQYWIDNEDISGDSPLQAWELFKNKEDAEKFADGYVNSLEQQNLLNEYNIYMYRLLRSVGNKCKSGKVSKDLIRRVNKLVKIIRKDINNES